MNRIIALMLLLSGCGGFAGSPPGVAVPLSGLRPEDRVLLGDFSTVQAVASSFDRMYVIYPNAVGVWRHLGERWEVPRAAPRFDALRDVFTAVIDPLDESLWLAAADRLWHFTPQVERWEELAVPGRIITLASDRTNVANPIWIRTTAGWFAQPRIGAATPGAPPATINVAPTLEDAYADLPQLRSLGNTPAIGAGLRPGQLTAAAPAPSGRGWYIGTTNRGLLYLDRTNVQAQRLSQGLMGDVVGAITLVAGGVWVATDDVGSDTPASLQFVANDLSRVIPLEGDPAIGLAVSAVRDLAATERAIWMATDRGVALVPIDGGRIERWDAARGLADSRAIVLTQWAGSMAVGAMRGLTLIDATNGPAHNFTTGPDPVYSLLPVGDTLWVGTGRGLRALARGDSALSVPTSWRRHSESLRAIMGIGRITDTMVVMTTDRMIWRNPLTGEWIPDLSVPASIGQLRAFHSNGSSVWIGGDRGAALWLPGVGVIRTLLVGPDLPGPVTDIAADKNWLWVGTTRGLVRIALAGG